METEKSRIIINTEDLSFAYEEDEDSEPRKALDGVTLSIERGSFVAIVGRNGSGKSTLAKNFNALLLPTGGAVFVDGMNTADDSTLWNIRRCVGMVFQNPDNQIVANVVEEDIAFGPENLGLDTEEIIRRVDSVVDALEVGAFRHKSPNRLSGGQKQRVAISGVMAMKPQCIVLDEPTAMLDPSGRKYVLEAVHELNRKEGITIVLITHYMEEAVGADRLIVMEGGTIARDADGNALDGTPEELFGKADELKRHALCVPVVTELALRLKEKGVDIPNGILTREELVKHLVSLKK